MVCLMVSWISPLAGCLSMMAFVKRSELLHNTRYNPTKNFIRGDKDRVQFNRSYII